ncbi:MAG: acyl-[acyl-carrier-protein] thioesterase [Lachnospiraceae bacterium]|jgi:medium-chain acyl-[acyl-carrier-protein] hydrolase
MKYSFDSRVRFSETDEDRKLTLNSIINYFQDCSTFQSELLGDGFLQLREQERVWMLSSWQIVIDRYPKLCEPITVSTWAYDFRHCFGSRNFTLDMEDGSRAAYANSLWVYVNTRNGKPEQIPEALFDLYKPEERLPMEYAPRKIAVPKDCQTLESFPVRLHHLDVNHHVNNGQYIEMARELLEEDFPVHQMRAEYKKQAKLGDMIVPKMYRDDSTTVVVLSDTDDQPYAIVEFQ